MVIAGPIIFYVGLTQLLHALRPLSIIMVEGRHGVLVCSNLVRVHHSVFSHINMSPNDHDDSAPHM